MDILDIYGLFYGLQNLKLRASNVMKKRTVRSTSNLQCSAVIIKKKKIQIILPVLNFIFKCIGSTLWPTTEVVSPEIHIHTKNIVVETENKLWINQQIRLVEYL